MIRYFDKSKDALPVLETRRLILRRLERGDFADMYDYAHREETCRYLLWTPHPSPEYTRSYLSMIGRFYRKGQFFDWAVVEKSTNRMIGTCGFSRLDQQHHIGEVGYVLNPSRQGRGYATEAVAKVIEYGFLQMGLNRIEGRYMVENIASRRVMEHCGLVFEGVLRQSMMVKGQYRDIGLCSLLREDYDKLCKARASAEIISV